MNRPCILAWMTLPVPLLTPILPILFSTYWMNTFIFHSSGRAKHYIKLNCATYIYIDCICEKYLGTAWSWFKPAPLTADHPTPLPNSDAFNKQYLKDEGDPNPKVQTDLANNMECKYWNVIGELTYAMVTCMPDISYETVCSAQASTCPAWIHFESVCHTMRYLYSTCHDGLYFWQSSPHDELPDTMLPHISSNLSDLMLPDWPRHDPYCAHGYVDSDWAVYMKIRRSFTSTSICLRLAGGTIAYKSKLQPTLAQSSTKAKFMVASDAGKMILYVRSILYDLDIPQHAASVLYEDNEGCITLWLQLVNQPLVVLILTWSTMLSVNGLSVTYSLLSESLLHRICRTTSQKICPRFFSTAMSILSWTMSHLPILPWPHTRHSNHIRPATSCCRTS